jgi:penicillin-binding protein 2
MRTERIYEDLGPLRKRSRLIWILIEIAFAALVFFYWKIQVLDYRKYWALSEANRTRDIIVPAPRGILRDRSRKFLLAGNRASFKASFIRENTKDFEGSLTNAGRLLQLDPAVIRERIEKYRGLPAFKPIVIKDELNQEEVALVEARRGDHPELIVETEPKRSYPFKDFAAHALGYLQELTPDELRTVYKGRRAGDMVGKSGVEAAYENRLVGQEGQLVEIVDSLGRKRQERDSVDPTQSQPLDLSLDFDLQTKAEELLKGKEGAVVVLSADTGEILAMASSPTYDPNKFINRFTPEEWVGLSASPEKPLLNRAVQGLYSPGSTFKIVMASGGLESGAITEATSFFCGGKTEIYGHEFSCMGAHGSLTLPDAIRFSCNIFFYNVGRRMGIDTIADYARRMGLGRKTGIDIPGEAAGLVPTPEWKKKTQKAVWFPGETISVAIGQGPLQVTPLQIAAVTALVANRGRAVIPHMLAAGEPAATAPAAAQEALSAANLERVVEGMWRSVNAGGSGQGAQIAGFDVCGKTGSTQTMSKEQSDRLAAQSKQRKTHSWFTGFAPRDHPRIVVSVLIEFGGLGGATAAPVARELFQLYKAKYAGSNPSPGN